MIDIDITNSLSIHISQNSHCFFAESEPLKFHAWEDWVIYNNIFLWWSSDINLYCEFGHMLPYGHEYGAWGASVLPGVGLSFLQSKVEEPTAVGICVAVCPQNEISSPK